MLRAEWKLLHIPHPAHRTSVKQQEELPEWHRPQERQALQKSLQLRSGCVQKWSSSLPEKEEVYPGTRGPLASRTALPWGLWAEDGYCAIAPYI
ncbi:hypothetical protein GN956_G22906 [Arapaima gigas]